MISPLILCDTEQSVVEIKLYLCCQEISGKMLINGNEKADTIVWILKERKSLNASVWNQIVSNVDLCERQFWWLALYVDVGI